MRSRSIPLLAAAICVVTAGLAAAQDQARPVPVDRHGDPLNGALARFGTQRWRHSDAVNFVAYLPDGKRVLTGAQDGTIYLWERSSGRLIHPFKMPAPKQANPGVGQAMIVVGRGYGQAGIAVSPDGKLLAAGTFNGVQLWDIDTGKELRQLKANAQNGLTTLLFSPDSKTLALRGFDRNIVLLDVASGNEIRRIAAVNNNINGRIFIAGQGPVDVAGIAFAPNGKTIASAETELKKPESAGYIRVCSLESGEQLRRIDTPPAGTSVLAYTPDGKILAQAGGTAIHLRDAESGKEIRKLNAPGGTAVLAFSKDGKTLIGKGRDGSVRVWNAESGEVIRTLAEAPAQAAGNNLAFARAITFTIPSDLSLSPDGKDVAIGGAKSPRIWDVASGKEQESAGGHRGGLLGVVFTRDGKSLLTIANDNTLRHWDAATGKELGQYATPPNMISAAFAPDGQTVAFATADGVIRLCDAETGKERAKLTGHVNGTSALVFSNDGKTLASRGNFDGLIRLHDAVKGTELRQIALFEQPGNGRVMFGGYGSNGAGLAFSHDGRTLAGVVGNFNNVMIRGGGVPAAQGPSNTVRLWDVGTGKELRKVDLPTQRGTGAIAFSPDGRLLAMENADQTFSLWEIASGKERAKFGEVGGVGPAGWQANGVMIAGGAVSSFGMAISPGKTLAFSPDGQLLATKAADHAIDVWQVSSTKNLADLRRHNAAVSTIAFSADGKRLVSGSGDTTALTWDVSTVACERAPLIDMSAEDALGFWNDLAADDAPKAYAALRALAGNAKQALPIFQKNLKAATPMDPKLLERLLDDLEDEKFAVRSKAKEELEKLGELAVPALQKRLDSEPPLETRRRIEPLLAKQLGGVLTSEQLRIVRAVEALEMLGTAEARTLLSALAEGAPGALATRQARTTLDRIDKR